MGVMSCYRSRCENIMCDTYISSVGYICDECIDEFKQYSRGKEYENEYLLQEDLEDFMKNTNKGTTLREGPVDVDDFFDRHTRKD